MQVNYDELETKRHQMFSENQKFKALFHLDDMEIKYQAWLIDQFDLLLTILPEIRENKEYHKKVSTLMATLINNVKKALDALRHGIRNS